MKHLLVVISCVVGLSISLASCKKTKDSESMSGADSIQKELAISDRFDSISQLKPTLNKMAEVINIRDWSLVNEQVIVQSDGTDKCFFVINTDHKVVTAFGKKGRGPNEFGAPNLIRSNSAVWIMDNAKQNIIQIKDINDPSKQEITPFSLSAPINWSSLLGDSLLLYAELLPKTQSLKSYSIARKESQEILSFNNKESKNTLPFDFWFSHNHDLVVVAHLYRNSIKFIQKQGAEFVPIAEFTKESEEGKIYYSDVVCTESKVFALSQKEIKTVNGIPEGFSSIEIFSLDGSPNRLIKLNCIVSRILPIDKGRKLWMLSPMDGENIYEIDLSKL